MEIETSARLHLSLIDLNGNEGRIDGGIGITLNKPSIQLECVENNDSTQIIFDKDVGNISDFSEYEQKINEACNNMNSYLQTDKTYTFTLKKAYPIHHGLGLGTQLLLSTGKLVSKLNDEELGVSQLAKIIQRGGTSGIGVGSFESGGFIVDGGHKKEQKNKFLPSSASKVSPPPVLARYDFPEDWNIILAIPDVNKSVSGQHEIDIFEKYTPVKIGDVERICYLTLMKLMPAVLEEDIISFGDAINKIQELGFKKVERDLQKDKINQCIEYLKNQGIPAVGMSSFGPTCFGITDASLKNIKNDLHDFLGEESSIIITKGKNHGSIIK
ncbi:MAG: beta-ribofuranosylaminobenzene 5'-phosphate synthase [Methanosphaera sp.]|nr:beta-ribofuranosylaminobenzene 5'-phosphate synthase [Methanosphaera sp.]